MVQIGGWVGGKVLPIIIIQHPIESVVLRRRVVTGVIMAIYNLWPSQPGTSPTCTRTPSVGVEIIIITNYCIGIPYIKYGRKCNCINTTSQKPCQQNAILISSYVATGNEDGQRTWSCVVHSRIGQYFRGNNYTCCTNPMAFAPAGLC